MSAVRLLPWIVHEGVEYVAGVLLILAPFLFGFDETRPTVLAVALGVLLLLIAVISRGRLGLTQSLPPVVHATLDYVLAGFLVLSPFLLGFTENTTALTFFVLLGVAHLAVTLLTAFPPSEEAYGER
jgi:hypothetical protein